MRIPFARSWRAGLRASPPAPTWMLSMAVLLALASASPAQTVDDVVRRYLDARGGNREAPAPCSPSASPGRWSCRGSPPPSSSS